MKMELQKIDMVLNKLYEVPRLTKHPELSIEVSHAILVRLHDEQLVDMGLYDNTMMGKSSFYFISSKGRELIEQLPKEFFGKPYTYRQKLNDAIKRMADENHELDIAVKQLTLRQSKTQTRVTFLALVIALISGLIPIIIFFVERNEENKLQLRVETLEKSIPLQAPKELLDTTVLKISQKKPD